MEGKVPYNAARILFGVPQTYVPTADARTKGNIPWRIEESGPWRELLAEIWRTVELVQFVNGVLLNGVCEPPSKGAFCRAK